MTKNANGQKRRMHLVHQTFQSLSRRSLFFNFTVTFQPGSENGKAGALSHVYEKTQIKLSNFHILDPSIIVAPIR